MKRFTVTITETYVNTFELDATDAHDAEQQAEQRAIERDFPADHTESCERTIRAETQE